ncbi:MAG: hypothetical protein HQK81_14780 [Desulfovibrionaceae bacterium]|nr:hypothetical protein [Desulfovibrionaceae bacterium]MBF0515310.1 hypothetical protein [Desulfovibrionaceae bacterium]
MAKKKIVKKAAKKAGDGPRNPFRSILIGLMLIGLLVAGVTVFGNLLDSRGQTSAAQPGAFTAAEVADAVRELRARQRDLNFNSPFGPGVLRAEEQHSRI